MAWLTVNVAGILEAGFAVCLKLSHGFTRLTPTALLAVFALSSFGLLTLGPRHIEVVGPAYAVWTGLGAAGTSRPECSGWARRRRATGSAWAARRRADEVTAAGITPRAIGRGFHPASITAAPAFHAAGQQWGTLGSARSTSSERRRRGGGSHRRPPFSSA